MKNLIEIGDKHFTSKKEALEYYKQILNSYNWNETLNQKDFKDVFELLETHPRAKDKIGTGIDKIRIAKLKYNTKAFELIRNDLTTEYFSYTKRINSPKSDFTKFRETCRAIIQDDLRLVKLEYFEKFSKKGKVKCQETNELLKWEDLTVDHRQPNTFSVIVDRFIEINSIKIADLKYKIIDGEEIEFEDNDLKEKFRNYHNTKANLRIIKKDLNKKRSYQARIMRQKKDLTINQ